MLTHFQWLSCITDLLTGSVHSHFYQPEFQHTYSILYARQLSPQEYVGVLAGKINTEKIVEK